MDDIYVDLRYQNEWIKKAFDDKDMVNIDEVLTKVGDLLDELEAIKEEYEDFKQDVADNYKYIPLAEQLDISDRDFI